MKIKITAIIMTLVAFCAAASGQSKQSDDNKAIGALMENFGTSWSTGDLKAFGELLTDDVMHLSPFGEVTVGKANVVKKIQWVHDVPYGGKKIEFKVSETTLNFTGADLAILSCRISYASQGAVKHPDERFTTVMAKVGSDWKIAQFGAVFINEPPQMMK